MALIDCPSCKKKISNKAESCQHCQLDLTSLDVEQVARLKQVNKINQQQKTMTQSFVAMLLFCGGFLFYFWQNPAPGSTQQLAAITATALGFVWYIICRVRLIILKRK